MIGVNINLSSAFEAYEDGRDYIEFFELLDIVEVDIISRSIDEVNYKNIKKAYKLSDIRDIVWMKFSSEGYLCTVACSNDINLDYVPKGEDPHSKKEKGKGFKYNTSAVILYELSLE